MEVVSLNPKYHVPPAPDYNALYYLFFTLNINPHSSQFVSFYFCQLHRAYILRCAILWSFAVLWQPVCCV